MVVAGVEPGVAGALGGDVGGGTGISLVWGAVVGGGATVVGEAVVVGPGVVVLVVVVELVGCVTPVGSWATAPGRGPTASDSVAVAAAIRRGRGSEIRTEVNRWPSAMAHVTRRRRRW